MNIIKETRFCIINEENLFLPACPYIKSENQIVIKAYPFPDRIITSFAQAQKELNRILENQKEFGFNGLFSIKSVTKEDLIHEDVYLYWDVENHTDTGLLIEEKDVEEDIIESINEFTIKEIVELVGTLSIDGARNIFFPRNRLIIEYDADGKHFFVGANEARKYLSMFKKSTRKLKKEKVGEVA